MNLVDKGITVLFDNMLTVPNTEMHSDSYDMCNNEHLLIELDQQPPVSTDSSRMSIPSIMDSQVPTPSIPTTPPQTILIKVKKKPCNLFKFV